MNLLFILPEFYPSAGGGIITFYQNLLTALRPHFNRIKVIVGSGYTQGVFEMVWQDIEVEYLQPDRYQKHLEHFKRFDFIPSFKNNLAAAWAIYEQARGGEGFDLVECNDFGLGYLPWVLKQDLPVIVRLHGSSGQITYHDPIPNENLAGDFFRQTELLTLDRSVSLQSYSTANSLFWEAQLGQKVTKILPIYLPPPGTLPLPFKDRSRNGLTTGRLQYWKGPLTVAEALQKSASATIVEWYGRDMHYSHSKMLMSHHIASRFADVWQKKLIYHQMIGSAETLRLQKTALYGLVPSDWDMFNMSCLEFMALGTPVICSEGAGVHDLICDGVNGFLFKAGDSNGLLDKINKLTALSPEAYEDLSRNAFQTISERLSPKTLVPLYLESYGAAKGGFRPLPENDYLMSTYGPDRQAQDIADLLDGQPLSKLLPYVKKRLLKKLKFK